MRFNKRWLLVIPVILIIAIAGFVLWAVSVAPMPEALTALENSDAVSVVEREWLVFSPRESVPDTGFIFYPGGRVPPAAYAPLANRLAADGYLVVIVPMPLNLAVFAPGSASGVIAAYPTITNWAIGGHSLGGAMAANFTAANADLIDGLVLWASYPQASDSLAAREDLIAASVYGTLDGLATVDQIEESRQYLPADTEFVAIEGGNHAYFGWYGEQGGDNPATITREAQQDAVYNATLSILRQIDS